VEQILTGNLREKRSNIPTKCMKPRGHKRN